MSSEEMQRAKAEIEQIFTEAIAKSNLNEILQEYKLSLDTPFRVELKVEESNDSEPISPALISKEFISIDQLTLSVCSRTFIPCPRGIHTDPRGCTHLVNCATGQLIR